MHDLEPVVCDNVRMYVCVHMQMSSYNSLLILYVMLAYHMSLIVHSSRWHVWIASIHKVTPVSTDSISKLSFMTSIQILPSMGSSAVWPFQMGKSHAYVYTLMSGTDTHYIISDIR